MKQFTKDEELNAEIYADLKALVDKYKPQITALPDKAGRYALQKNFIEGSERMLYFLKVNSTGIIAK